MALIDGLISYYKCEDDAANTTVVDIHSTNDGTATANTSTMSTTGKINNGLNMGGSKKVATFKIPTGDFSISLWVNSASFINNARIYDGKQIAVNKGVRIFVPSSGIPTCNVYDGTNNSSITSDTALSTGAGFQHVVLTSNGSNGDTIMYIDNSSVGSNSSGAGHVAPDDSTVLTIGGSASGDEYNGVFDEIGIFDKVLTPTEVGELFLAPPYPFSAATLRQIKLAGTFVEKPILTKVSGTFVDKPIKIKVGGTFQDA